MVKVISKKKKLKDASKNDTDAWKMECTDSQRDGQTCLPPILKVVTEQVDSSYVFEKYLTKCHNK